MWDMPDNATSIALIEAFVKADKPGAVCHAPAALVNVRGKDGEYLVSERGSRMQKKKRWLDRGRTFLAGRPAKGTG